MDIYGKDEQEDLTADQKRILKKLAEETKLPAIRYKRGVQRGAAMKSSRISQVTIRTVEDRHGGGDPPTAAGEIALKTTVAEIPDPPPEIRPEELTKLRIDNRMSQDVFARVLNVPTRKCSELGRRDRATLAGVRGRPDPGLPPEHLRCPLSGRDDRRSKPAGQPEEADVSIWSEQCTPPGAVS